MYGRGIILLVGLTVKISLSIDNSVTEGKNFGYTTEKRKEKKTKFRIFIRFIEKIGKRGRTLKCFFKEQ
jgi:hypothetical protein